MTRPGGLVLFRHVATGLGLTWFSLVYVSVLSLWLGVYAKTLVESVLAVRRLSAGARDASRIISKLNKEGVFRATSPEAARRVVFCWKRHIFKASIEKRRQRLSPLSLVEIALAASLVVLEGFDVLWPSWNQTAVPNKLLVIAVSSNDLPGIAHPSSRNTDMIGCEGLILSVSSRHGYLRSQGFSLNLESWPKWYDNIC